LRWVATGFVGKRYSGGVISHDDPERLSGLLPALWHALVRAVRSAEELPALPESQVRVLHTLVATGGSTPARLAADLHLARPTVSNLVRDLMSAGLVERHKSPRDGRSVLLVPTLRAREVLGAFGRGRVAVVSNALSHLSEVDRAAVLAALPALESLLAQLKTMHAKSPHPSPLETHLDVLHEQALRGHGPLA
jgi:DNA-binding MarR family transcriptional regulator